MTGTYSEKLKCGGTLEVTMEGFKIHYYFPGPDLRHNGTFVDTPGTLLPEYIKALLENWKEYQHLKSSIPSGGEFHKKGRQGMEIRIGSCHEGVCLRSYHMPIKSEAGLQLIINSFEYASKRATQVQSFLQRL